MTAVLSVRMDRGIFIVLAVRTVATATMDRIKATMTTQVSTISKIHRQEEMTECFDGAYIFFSVCSLQVSKKKMCIYKRVSF